MIDILLFSISYKLITYYALINKPILFSSKTVTTTDCNINDKIYNKRIEEIIDNCQSLHRNYFPSFIFTNCHLQMIPFILNNSFQKKYFKPFNWISEKVELIDNEIIILDWANTIPDYNVDDESPILLINHGAGGTSRDFPGQTYVDKALKNGWRVCVLNRRGHCGRLTKGKFNFFGSCDDLELVIDKHIKSKRPKSKLLLLGISAGSGLVATYMGKQGLKNMSSSSRGFVYAAVGICPGYNIEKCMGKMGFPYASLLLNLQKYLYMDKNRKLLENMSTFKQCYEANDLQEWSDNAYQFADENFTCSKDYYDNNNPMRFVQFINQPSLFINSEDDPLCKVENVYEGIPLFANTVHAPPCLAVALTKTGSHCSFYEFSFFPFHCPSWSERVTIEFFENALLIKG